jgi:PII-like signaling protein
MERETEAVLLRLFIGESDHWDGKPLHTAIVEKARQEGLAGATVLRGLEGFGARSVIHTARLLDLSTDLPIVVEIVDTEEKVMAFLQTAEAMVKDGLATLEKVRVVFYRHDRE